MQPDSQEFLTGIAKFCRFLVLQDSLKGVFSVRMKYEITITRIEEKPVTKRGDYTVIDRVPWTAKALDSEHTYGGIDAFLKENPLREVRGYAPDCEGVEVVKTEVLSQVTETLDLVAVIKAINGI